MSPTPVSHGQSLLWNMTLPVQMKNMFPLAKGLCWEFLTPLWEVSVHVPGSCAGMWYMALQVWYDSHSVTSEQVCVCEGQADSMLAAFEVSWTQSCWLPRSCFWCGGCPYAPSWTLLDHYGNMWCWPGLWYAVISDAIRCLSVSLSCFSKLSQKLCCEAILVSSVLLFGCWANGCVNECVSAP